MKITEIQVTPIKPNNGLVGFASIVFDEKLYLGSIGIYTKPNGGYRLTYPTKGKGDSINIFHPISRAVGEAIESAVISKFEEVTSSYDRYNKASN